MENLDGIKNYEKLEVLLLKCPFSELSEEERKNAMVWAGSQENFDGMRKLLLEGKNVLDEERSIVPSPEIYKSLSGEFSLRNQSLKGIDTNLNTLMRYPVPLYRIGIAAMIVLGFFLLLNQKSVQKEELDPKIVIRTDTVFQVNRQIDTVYLEKEIVVEKPVYVTQNIEEEEMYSDEFAERFEEDPFLDFQIQKDFYEGTVGITMEEDSTFMEFQAKGI
ncbi:hypothetical protein [Flexithrix dorotheae]|uniref:hypothetical protein n=1 Tax=Flexithrix dorotheae TaxID=70993 RepID=UPI00036A718C|nr:hypothetical protein [Flexithrix dorotheae]